MRHKSLLVAALIAEPVLANNGVNFLSVTPESHATGGAGVGHLLSPAQAIFQNPALLSRSKAANSAALSVTKAAVDYKVAVKDSFSSATPDTGYQGSAYEPKLVPTFAGSYRLNDKVNIGFGSLIYSGIGTDFKGKDSHLQLGTAGAFMRFPLSLAYEIDEKCSVAIAPFALRGELGVNIVDTDGSQTKRKPSKSTGYGVQVGTVGQLTPELSLGLTYISSVTNVFKKTLNLDAFTAGAANPATAGLDDLTVEQPAEWALGLGYSEGDLSVMFDIRAIMWGESEGFRQFGFKNQTVFALGTDYALSPDWSLQAGYNYGKAALPSNSRKDPLGTTRISDRDVFNFAIDKLDGIGLAAISEHHFGLGARYQVNPEIGLGAAYSYSPEAHSKLSGEGTTLRGAPGSYQVDTKLKVQMVVVGIDYQAQP